MESSSNSSPTTFVREQNPEGTFARKNSSKPAKSILPLLGKCITNTPQPISTPTKFGTTLLPRLAVNPIVHPAP